MDPILATKTAIDVVNNEGVINRTADLVGMLLPYLGIKKKAVDVYIEEIKKSNLSPEAKALTILNTKRDFKKLFNQKAIAEIAINNSDLDTDFS